MGMQFFATVILNISAEKVRIIHVHISSIKEERFYHVRDVNARQFRLRESEIFYLEARHNHVLWNCENVQLETVGSFKETEKSLSEEFVRIYRGFIVNRQRVCKIARCYAELDNGKTLQISSIPATECILRLTDALSSNQVAKKLDTRPVNGDFGSDKQK